MKKQEKLDQIKADIIKDNVCPDLAKQATQLVFADGSADAEIVFIGEAPGKNEDLQGQPFVGAAGRFLDEMLAMISLERKDIYITNIVKYRPPNNRDPLPEEKQAFLPYLLEQLKVLQPKLVITLGRHSMEVFLPGLKISSVHGQPKRVQLRIGAERAGGQSANGMQGDNEKRIKPYKSTATGVSQLATQQSVAKHGKLAGSAGEQPMLSLVILPLFHPAAALYNGGMRQTLIDDFAKIPLVLNKLELSN